MWNKRSKYGAKKTVFDGIKFDSKKEANRYYMLKGLVNTKVISNLELQPRYDIIINDKFCGFYKADFRYINNAGTIIIEDCKGFKTAIYNLKKKIIEAMYNIKILET